MLSSCTQLEKAEALINGLPPKEEYKKEQRISDELFNIWESRAETGLKESVEIELPYAESGTFKPRNFGIYSYQTYLMPGEVLETEIFTDTTHTLVFADIYKKEAGQDQFIKIKSGIAKERKLKFEIKEKGLYKILIQPEIEANSPFRIHIQRSPAYMFPVDKGRNGDIGSYWGDIRDGGKREHKGIDIFAEKGTPVIAATEGRIKYAGEKGLGGKQIWLRDRKRKLSLYYAHLDSIIPDLKKVKSGDTIGFVGNTGNAVHTPPHLHFGIYQNNHGAIDPLGFVYQTEELSDKNPALSEMSARLKINARRASLRKKPASNNSRVVRNGELGEILYVQGKSADWFHVRDSLDNPLFIHESQVIHLN